LGKIGYRADVVETGLEAVQALERQPYDVLLLDVQMPKMDGLAVARYVCQKWPQEQRPYMIAVTANAMQDDREECLNAGMDDYIVKPVRVEELISAIHKHRPGPNETRAAAAPAFITTEERSLPNTTSTPSMLTSIDSQVLARFREALGENSQQLLATIIDTYLDDTPVLLATMRAAVNLGDAAALKAAAHKLQSSSAVLGATGLAKLCIQLEDIGRTGTAAQWLDLVLQIEAEFERFKAALT
jgi:CheY-like chemotaxis protein